jgi:type IV pilus assembly protein PilB
MCKHVRIGELLSRMVALSGHDIEEILQEQEATHRRFGEIALSWGLCQPEHLWTAWCAQLADGTERIDLNDVGIDAQAAALLPGEIARRWRVIPVRIGRNGTLVACASELDASARAEIERFLRKPVTYVAADAAQVDASIDAYYPALQTAI